MSGFKYRPWLPSEDAELRRFWGISKAEVLASKMGRNIKDINARADALRLNAHVLIHSSPKEELAKPKELTKEGLPRVKNNWTKEDTDFLLDNLPKMPIIDIAICLGRTRDAVNARIRTLGIKVRIKTPRAREPWTVEEINQLIERHPHLKNRQIAELMGRSEVAISKKASEYELQKLHKWTSEEIQWFEANYPLLPNSEIAKKLNCSVRDVRRKAETLGLGKVKSEMIKDQQAVAEFIAKNLPTRGRKWCAQTLGVSVETIARYHKSPTKWTEADIAELKTYIADGHSPQYIADRINREISIVKMQTRALGLKNNREMTTNKTDKRGQKWADLHPDTPMPFRRPDWAHSSPKNLQLLLNANNRLDFEVVLPHSKKSLQRPPQWDLTQQQLFIEHLAMGGNFGLIYLVQCWAGDVDNFAVLDGKNRLMAAQAFFRGEIAYRASFPQSESAILDGKKYGDMHPSLKVAFGAIHVDAVLIDYEDDRQLIDIFMKVNLGAAPQSAEHLDSLRKLRAELEK